MKKNIKEIGNIIGKFLLLIIFWIISIVVADGLTPFLNEKGKPFSTFFFEFIPFIGLVLGHFVMIKFFEKSNFNFIRLDSKNLLSNIIKGCFIGLFWLLLSVLVIYLIGNGKLNNTFSLSTAQLTFYFLVLFINAFMQELLVHGYLFSLLENKYTKIVALITTSLLFLLLHPGAMNSGVIASLNVFGAGLIFGLIIIKFNSLLSATLAHTVWNYFGAVWFGLIPLDNYPTMKLISLEGNPLIVGDKNGIETSIIITITTTAILTYLCTKKQPNLNL